MNSNLQGPSPRVSAKRKLLRTAGLLFGNDNDFKQETAGGVRKSVGSTKNE
jgi:hypothetical protein